jgi:hypothetical protein
MQADPASAALGVVVPDPHLDDRTNAAKGVDHGRNEGPIAQTHNGGGIQRVQEFPRFLLGQHRRLAFRDRVLGAADWGCGTSSDNLTHDQPVKEHSDGRQMLLDRRVRHTFPQQFDVGGHVERLYIDDLREVLRLTPRRKVQNRMQIGPPGVGIADIGSKVLDEALGRLARRRIERRDCLVQSGVAGSSQFLAHTRILSSTLLDNLI